MVDRLGAILSQTPTDKFLFEELTSVAKALLFKHNLGPDSNPVV